MRCWYVYLARCADGTLYTGVTTDLARRMAQHCDGTGAKYTRSRGGARLVSWEAHATKGRALSREIAVKRLTRARKLEIPRVEGIRPAAPADMTFIRRTIATIGMDDERMSHEQYVIVGARHGFARIKPYAKCFELGSVVVLPCYRRRGVGASLVRFLVARFPSRRIWLTTASPEYFEKLGFRRGRPPAELRAKLSKLARVHGRRDIVPMACARPQRPALSPADK